MKKIILLFTLLWSGFCSGQPLNSVLWIQQPAISPDGHWIAFEYKGNIYKISITGGNALPLTTNNAYNGYPVWSHDSKSIAFASNRYGNFDVFIIPSSGGEAKRLTFNSAKDIPYDFSPDNTQVYFGTDRHDIPTSVRFPYDNLWMKLYKVPAVGGRNLLVNSAGTEYLHLNKDGSKYIFQDRKGYEDPWRKHHQSAVTRDIWVYDLKSKTYLKVSDFYGEDREPVWGTDDTFYYLSERNGNQNVFKSTIDHPSIVNQLTTFTKDPVRNLSRSDDGLLAFTQGGELYTLREGGAPLKVDVVISADFNAYQIQTLSVKEGATELCVSPNGKEIAFAARGEIYVADLNGTNTRRITNTPYRESMVHFSPDGRTIIYSSEKNGIWEIDEATIANKKEPYFYAATVVNTNPLIATSKSAYEGMYSPDGTKVAYVEDRKVLKVYDLSKKTSVTVLPEGNIFTYVDGNDAFQWSPDGRHLIIPSSEGHNSNNNVILIAADGKGQRVNVTQSGFNTDMPQWAANGKMIYYMSNKEGLRSLSQGPSQSDIYATFFDQEVFINFRLNKEELALKEEIQKRDSLLPKKAVNDSPNPGNGSLDLSHLENRTMKLSQNSAELADIKLSADGEKMYFLAKYDNNFDVWVTDLRSHDTKKLTELGANSGSLEFSKDGKSLIVLADGKVWRVDPENGSKAAIEINPSIEINSDAERAAIFEHTYQRMLKLFFDPKLQGVDWKYYHDQYARFLPYVNNNYDFQVLLSEFLGELNSSHTGGRYSPSFPEKDETGALGLLYDLSSAEKGLMVREILEGGPFDLAGSKLRPGFVLDKIDGQYITANADWAPLLNHKKGKYTSVEFINPNNGVTYQETVRPISNSDENELLYNRWVAIMEHLTDSLSHGRVGYVHVREMDESSYRQTIDRIEGKNRNKKALIIDTRFNGGGNLHDQLVKYLSERTTILARPQSQYYIQDSPPDGSPKPTCVLMSEGNYSDAYNFPYLYQRLKIGKVIGTPVAGTGTGVFWERQTDKTIVIGFPQLGLSWIGEPTLLENHEIQPDIKVYNQYEKVLNGTDEQLEVAVKEMLKMIN